MYGPLCVEYRRIRTNEYIDELIGHEDMASFVKSLRIRWLGRVERMNNFFFSISVCAITPSGVPGGAFLSVNRFSTLCG
jgi:hypothetical protein